MALLQHSLAEKQALLDALQQQGVRSPALEEANTELSAVLHRQLESVKQVLEEKLEAEQALQKKVAFDPRRTQLAARTLFAAMRGSPSTKGVVICYFFVALRLLAVLPQPGVWSVRFDGFGARSCAACLHAHRQVMQLESEVSVEGGTANAELRAARAELEEKDRPVRGRCEWRVFGVEGHGRR